MVDIYKGTSYDKYGLISNPFSQLASEGINNFSDIHVRQDADSVLRNLVNDVVEGDSSAAISLTGPLGAGKTQRLKMVSNEVRNVNGKVIFIRVDTTNPIKLTRDIFEEFREEKEGLSLLIDKFWRKMGREDPLDKYLSSKDNYRAKKLAELLREEFKKYDNAALILDEFENFENADQESKMLFFEFIRHFISDLPNGTIFSIASTPTAYDIYKSLFSAFFARLHYEVSLGTMEKKEAKEMVKKRLKGKRTRTRSQTLYPFTEESVEYIHDTANGNPRTILRLLHLVLMEASRRDLDEINSENISKILEEPKSVEEYMNRIPPDLKTDIKTIMVEFDGGPVSYIELAKKLKTRSVNEYERLEELKRMGFLKKEKGQYVVPASIRDLSK